MKLHELKSWLDNLPDEMKNFTVVNGEVGLIDGKYMYQVDKPLTTLTVDADNKEIVLMNDSNETEENIIKNS